MQHLENTHTKTQGSPRKSALCAFALTLAWLMILAIVCFAANPPVATPSRVKDIAHLRGVRENQLIGYGLIAGLNGTGDKQQTIFTIQTITSMLQKMGMTVSSKSMRIQNVAAVIVTASLPPFPRSGQAIDVTVSSIGDAKSLQGGVLILTPLKAMDGQVYAMAQGPVLLGGYTASGGAGGGARQQTNHPTVGRVPGGATVEREVPFTLQGSEQVVYTLEMDDFSTASALARTINTAMKSNCASALDSRTISIKIPEAFRANPVEFISQIETLPVDTDQSARVVIDEKTGTVVMGREMKISAVAVMHGNLSVEVSTTYQVSQPKPLSQGKTVVVPETNLQATEEKAKNIVLGQGTTVDDLVKALNNIGATPRDVVAILMAIRAAGALKATIVVI